MKVQAFYSVTLNLENADDVQSMIEILEAADEIGFRPDQSQASKMHFELLGKLREILEGK